MSEANGESTPITSNEKLQRKLASLQKAYSKAKSENASLRRNASEKSTITSLAYSEELGLTLERTHLGKQLLYEDPKKLLGKEYNAITKTVIPLLVLANKALNSIPVDERYKVYAKDAEGKPIKGEPQLDPQGRPVYTVSYLDKVQHDLDILLQDQAFVKALGSLTEAMAKHRDEFYTPELKTDKPYINKVKSAPAPEKSTGRGGRGR